MKFSLATSLALVSTINALPLTSLFPQSILNLPIFNSINNEHSTAYLSDLNEILSSINDETLNEAKYKELKDIDT